MNDTMNLLNNYLRNPICKTCQLLILTVSCCLLGCYQPGTGANSEVSRGELEQFIGQNVDTEKKYYILAEKMAQLLDEAAAISNDEAAMDHLRKFYNDNKTALTQIEREFDGWQRNVSQDQLIDFVLILNEQAYARRLQQLVSSFRERIKYRSDWVQEFNVLVGILDIKR